MEIGFFVLEEGEVFSKVYEGEGDIYIISRERLF